MVDPFTPSPVNPNSISTPGVQTAVPGVPSGGRQSPLQGPAFHEVLQRVRESEELQEKTIQQVKSTQQVQTTQDIDRMMQFVDLSFEATQRVSKSLGAAIDAYKKSDR